MPYDKFALVLHEFIESCYICKEFLNIITCCKGIYQFTNTSLFNLIKVNKIYDINTKLSIINDNKYSFIDTFFSRLLRLSVRIPRLFFTANPLSCTPPTPNYRVPAIDKPDFFTHLTRPYISILYSYIGTHLHSYLFFKLFLIVNELNRIRAP